MIEWTKFIGDRITELRIQKNISEYQMSLDLGKNKKLYQSISTGRSLQTIPGTSLISVNT